jgi:hypothetical protein
MEYSADASRDARLLPRHAECATQQDGTAARPSNSKRQRNASDREPTLPTGPPIAEVKEISEERTKGGRSGETQGQSAGPPELQAVLFPCVVIRPRSLLVTREKLVDQERRAVTKSAITGTVLAASRETGISGLCTGRTTVAPLGSLPKAREPGAVVSFDITGAYGTTPRENNYSLTYVAHFTECAETLPLPDQEAATVANALVTQIFTRHGVCGKLLSDSGSNFTSELFREVCRLLGVNKIFTSPYGPQCSGQVGRYHRTLHSGLATYADPSDTNWDENENYVLWAYRSQPHSATDGEETPRCRFLYGDYESEKLAGTEARDPRTASKLGDNVCPGEVRMSGGNETMPSPSNDSPRYYVRPRERINYKG